MNHEVTVYSKPDCPLCDKAIELLEQHQRRVGFELVVVDITQDDELFNRYCFDIPVVLVDGEPKLQGIIDKQSLKRMFGNIRKRRK